MAKKRMTRKQLLKEPDEFITTTGKLIAWARGNAKPLIAGTTLFFITIIAVSVYGFFNQKRSSTAQEMFAQAVTKYQSKAAETDSGEALSAVSADFDALIDSYGGLSAGRLGRLFYGHISNVAKDHDKAIESYQKALKDFGDDTSLGNIIHSGLALAYQQKGDYPKAIAHYQKIVESVGSVMKDAALFNLGKLYGQLGKTEESRQAFQELSDDFPNSMYADIAREKISG